MMKRLFVTASILAFAAFVAWAQGDVTLEDALRVAAADANFVLISDEGRIVGYSENLSRTDLHVVLADGFLGEVLLLITAPDGTVTHEYRALVSEGGVVTVDARALAESLAAAGFGPPTFVTASPPDEAPRGPGNRPDQAGGPPDLPPQAGGPPAGGRGNGAADGAGRGAGRGGDDGDEDDGDEEDGDEEDGENDEGDRGEDGGPGAGQGEGPPDSVGAP